MSLVNSGLMIYTSSTLTSVHTPLADLDARDGGCGGRKQGGGQGDKDVAALWLKGV